MCQMSEGCLEGFDQNVSETKRSLDFAIRSVPFWSLDCSLTVKWTPKLRLVHQNHRLIWFITYPMSVHFTKHFLMSFFCAFVGCHHQFEPPPTRHIDYTFSHQRGVFHFSAAGSSVWVLQVDTPPLSNKTKISVSRQWEKFKLNKLVLLYNIYI